MTPAPQIPGLRFIEPIKDGGYARVLLYEQEHPRMRVAVKVLHGSRLTDRQREQFAVEANTMAELADHPYIVPVLAAGQTASGEPYLVMRYFPPPDLGARVRQSPLRVDEALRTGIHLASAVESAHRAGILHRDIKPANILMSQYGVPGLTDFGIAGRAAEVHVDDDIGVSVPWAPPEVLVGQSNGSVAADVYSLGATLFTLLVGHSPFAAEGGDARAMLNRVLRNPAPATGRADVPGDLDRLLMRCLAKEPQQRPASALDLARELQAIEMRLGYSRTDVVGLDAGGSVASTPAAEAPAGESTRMKTPQRVEAQPPTPRPVGTAPISTPVDSTAQRTPVVGPTQSRVVTPEPADGAIELPARPPAPGRRLGLVVAGAVAVIAVVVATQVLGHGGGGKTPSGGHTLPAPTPDAPVNLQTPELKPTRTGDRVRWTWTWGRTNANEQWWFKSDDHDWIPLGPKVRSKVVRETTNHACASLVLKENGQEVSGTASQCES